MDVSYMRISLNGFQMYINIFLVRCQRQIGMGQQLDQFYGHDASILSDRFEHQRALRTHQDSQSRCRSRETSYPNRRQRW